MMLGGFAALVVLGFFGWSLWRLDNATASLRETELEFEVAAQELLATVGFDGMIHDFKNCVLRPAEPRYCDEARDNAALALTQLDTLEQLAASAGLTLDVGDIRDAVEAYGASTDDVRDAHVRGLPIPEIDALVRYDDTPATRQIRTTLTLTRDAMQARLTELVRSLWLQAAIGTTALVLIFLGVGSFIRRESRLSAEREERLSAVFSALSGGLIGLDPKGRIMMANPAARALLQLGGAEPPLVWPAHLVLQEPGEDGRVIPWPELLADALGAKQLKGRILVLKDSSRSEDLHFIRLASAAIDMRSGKLSAILLLDDITDLERNRQQIERNSRLDALGQLTGGMAHDFNNLLATILYAIELARKDTTSDTARAMLERALTSIGRGRELTARLLTFARRQPGSSRSSAVTELFDEFAQVAHSAVEASVELVFEPGDEDLRVYCDPAQLENAMLNLVLNSRDAIRSSGIGDKIRIGARGVTTSNPSLLHRQGDDATVGQDYRFVEITVTDNGPGMSAEVRRRATDPFFTTKEKAKGTGLGLAMVYGFVRQSNGEMRIYSDEGRGTTIRMTLPRGGMEDEREEPQDRPEVPRGQGETVLLTEDEPDLLFMMSQMLQELGYRVIEASDGRAALEMVEAGTSFDILLSDVVMPGGIDGIELARRVHDRHPDKGILLMSGYVSLSEEAREQVDFPVLQKPCMPSELSEALRRISS